MIGKIKGKKILVLGGGFGGVQAAINARNKLDSSQSVSIIDRSRMSYLCGMNPMLIIGKRQISKTGRSLGRLANRGINFIESEINSIDLTKKSVSTSQGDFLFDYLVIALGAEYDIHAVPGSQNAYSFWDFQSARKLRRRLSRFKKGKIILAAAKPPYKCPPAPFETAMLINSWAREKNIRPNVDIHVYIPEPKPLGVAGPEASQQITSDLERRGITLHTSAGVTKISDNGKKGFFQDDSSSYADIIAVIPVHKLPMVVQLSGISHNKPWVPVNKKTLETTVENVFAIGDVNVIPTGDFAIPKAGVFASDQGTTVGKIIAARINNSQIPTYNGYGKCFLAYSMGTAAMVGGSFLEDSGPKTSLSSPSVSSMRIKETFESNWRNFKI